MNAAAGLVEVRVPDMGNFKDVAIIDVLVKPGESIEPEAPLLTLETEKATMDVPSTVGGVIEKIHVAKGGTVSAGDLVVTVRSDSAPSADAGKDEPSASRTPAGGDAQLTGSSARANSERRDSAARDTASADAASADSPPSDSTTRPVQASSRSSRPAKPSSPGQPSGSTQTSTSAAAQPGQLQSGQASAPGKSAQGPTAPAPKTAPARERASGSESAPPRSGAPADQGQRSAAGNGAAGKSALPPIGEPGFSRVHAGPSVRKFARELGVDLNQVGGGGFKGRVTHEDVKNFVKKSLATPTAKPGYPAGSGLPSIPEVDFAQFGPIELRPLGRIQKISGPRLHASWVNIPHVTQFDTADITELEETRNKLKQQAQQAGIKLTPLAFIMRACVKALQEFPVFNSSLDASGANLVMKNYIHLGFAADTPNGLVVPVVHDADRKDVYEVARHLADLSEKARAGKLTPAQMQGGSFTISSLGGIGGTAFTPIINAPEVAILGVSRSSMQPVFHEGQFIPRLMLPLSLSYDHRVIDGATAARFTTFLVQTLADARSLLEAVP